MQQTGDIIPHAQWQPTTAFKCTMSWLKLNRTHQANWGMPQVSSIQTTPFRARNILKENFVGSPKRGACFSYELWVYTTYTLMDDVRDRQEFVRTTKEKKNIASILFIKQPHRNAFLYAIVCAFKSEQRWMGKYILWKLSLLCLRWYAPIRRNNREYILPQMYFRCGNFERKEVTYFTMVFICSLSDIFLCFNMLKAP